MFPTGSKIHDVALEPISVEKVPCWKVLTDLQLREAVTAHSLSSPFGMTKSAKKMKLKGKFKVIKNVNYSLLHINFVFTA